MASKRCDSAWRSSVSPSCRAMPSVFSRTRTRAKRKSASRRCCPKNSGISRRPTRKVSAVPPALNASATQTRLPGTRTPNSITVRDSTQSTTT